MVARLPAFPQAPMDELLDLRSDLRVPLTRYRAAVIRLAADVPVALGKDGEAAIDDLWTSAVDPALLELRETLSDHALVREVARHAVTDVKTILATGPVVFIGMSALSTVGDVAAALTAGTTYAGSALLRGGWDAGAAKRTASRRELFFLYEANRKMAGATGPRVVHPGH